MIVFTLRELKRAWRQTSSAFDGCNNKTNAHRLLLFYAVETGLKAVMLKRESKQDSEGMFADSKHDLNKLLIKLCTGSNLHLPSEIHLAELNRLTQSKQRNANCSELNQIWRYGAESRAPTDIELEAKLSAINEWIKGELK